MTDPVDQQASDEAPRCTHCRRLLFDTELARWACRVCEERASGHLRELPALYDQLGDLLQPAAHIADQSGKVTVSTAAPLPVRMEALDLRAPGGIVTRLQAVENTWRALLGWTVATWRGSLRQTLDQVTNSLLNNLRWACENHPEIADDLDTVSALYWRAHNTVTGKQARIIYLPCRALIEQDTECGARLAVDINKTSSKCPACGTRWGREQWDALYQATRAEAA